MDDVDVGSHVSNGVLEPCVYRKNRYFWACWMQGCAHNSVPPPPLISQVTREQLEEWAKPGLERLRKLLQEGLDASGLKAADIASVEVVGSATRVPAVFKVVEEVSGPRVLWL